MKAILPRSRPSRREGPSRRQRVPPALTRGDDRFDGFAILDEVPGDVGVVLWQSVRNVFLWATTPPDRRPGLFAEEAADLRAEQVRRLELESELQAPLSVVVSMLRHPDRADVSRVVNACRRIALWAENRGALATALAFSQAAALCAPQSPILAYAVGRLARRCAQYDRAESWYTRAVIQGRHARDWTVYARSWAGMGTLHLQRGNYPQARRALQRCLRAATRHGLMDLRAIAYHDLFIVEVESGSADSDWFAQQALLAYSQNHANIPRLAYDIAFYWTEQGRFEAATPVAFALVDLFEAPAERALTLSLAARAAAGSGDTGRFHATAAKAMALMNTGLARDAEARSLLALAFGAASLRDWDYATASAERALTVARERHEGRFVIAAAAAVDAVRTRSTRASSIVDEEAQALSEQIVRSLRAFGVPVSA